MRSNAMMKYGNKHEIALFVIILLFLHTVGFADDKKKVSYESKEKQAQSIPASPLQVKPMDPFVTTEQIKQSVQQKGEIPLMQLKGLIEGVDRSPVALLDIQGFGIYIVHREDTISLQYPRQNIVLRIKDIVNNSVIVDVGTLGRVMVVR
ncbi:MAG: hypothetical protein Q8P28_09455 [Deltaproteobacteria bacterium]|nr:hypothetical protein [Deltaproteobacteria bacterium]